MRLRGLNSPSGTPGSKGLNVMPSKETAAVTSIQFGSMVNGSQKHETLHRLFRARAQTS